MNWSQIISIAAVSVTVPLILRYLGRLFPIKPNTMPSEQEFSDTEVKKWNSILIPIYLLLSGFTGGIIWLGLKSVGEFLRDGSTDALIYLDVPGAMLALPAMIGGLGISALPIELIGKRLMKDRYALYEMASSRAFGGMNSKQLMKPFLITTSFLALFGGFAVIRTKMLVFNDRIESCGPVSCESYLTSEIVEIGQSKRAVAPIGTVVPRRDIYLRFRDGLVWSPFILSNDPMQDKVAATLSSITGLVVKQVDLLPEI